MGNPNRGKPFESVIRESFERVSDTSVVRLMDATNRAVMHKGVKNPCDFIVYKYPHQLMIECKSTHDGTLHFSKITQWESLFEYSKFFGVVSGVIVWFIKYDVTFFIDIITLERLKEIGAKSISHNDATNGIVLHGKKRRIYYDYDMHRFFDDIGECYD